MDLKHLLPGKRAAQFEGLAYFVRTNEFGKNWFEVPPFGVNSYGPREISTKYKHKHKEKYNTNRKRKYT